jgi:DNA-binding transcriptional LysR family regulator
MELRDMEYFAVVAEKKHLGRAADALGMSQSALSKCLRRIEVSVGTKIVVRTAKGVELTAAGSALLLHVSKLRLAHEDINREIEDLDQGQSGYVRIGISPGFGEELVGPSIGLLLDESPNVTLKVKVLTPAEMLLAAGNGELDLVITSTAAYRQENMVHEPLLDDEFVFYTSLDHPLGKRRKITLNDIAQEKWTAHIGSNTWEALQREFAKRKLPVPRLALESDSLAVRFHAITSHGLL